MGVCNFKVLGKGVCNFKVFGLGLSHSMVVLCIKNAMGGPAL